MDPQRKEKSLERKGSVNQGKCIHSFCETGNEREYLKCVDKDGERNRLKMFQKS